MPALVVAYSDVTILPGGVPGVPVPAAAQAVADQMVAGGVRALLNYAPVVPRVPPGVTVREIDPVGAMQSMTYYLGEDSP